MKKIYVLDTSVLIDDPVAYKHFKDSNVVIPIIVINELDKKKLSVGDAGKNARVCCRLLDKICDRGDIKKGVLLDDNILLIVDPTYIDLNNDLYKGFGDPQYPDTNILVSTYILNAVNSGGVTLVTNDINLRIKAKARGINAIAHESAKRSISELYSGNQVIIDEDAGLDLQKKGTIDPQLYNVNLHSNECAFFEDSSNNGLALSRLISKNKLKLIKKVYPWNISARNKEQSFAIDLIMDKNIDLVTLIGKAGSGKTLIAMATALELVINRREYNKLVIYRPIQPVGNDIGFLPGTLEEKLEPWFQAVMDNFETLFQTKTGGDWRRELEMYQKKGRIELEAITYIRGRSIPNAIILLDECQNLSKEDVKTVLTRAGEGTKIILTGDIEQIDNSVLDVTSNGLTYVIEKFKNSDLAGHITFTQGERSKLATLASEIL